MDSIELEAMSKENELNNSDAKVEVIRPKDFKKPEKEI